MSIKNIRREFTSLKLDDEIKTHNPFELFKEWLNHAIDNNFSDATAMVFISVNQNHQPSGRMVLLKEFSSEGFTFFTNYESRKATDIEVNNQVSLLFYWSEADRQIRIEGEIFKISPEKSDEYFAIRPVGSKVGAWVSPQSQVIPSREYLEKLNEEYQTKWKDKNIPRPKNWGGYIIKPKRIEFWQGRENRLHDRLLFTQNQHEWKCERLAP